MFTISLPSFGKLFSWGDRRVIDLPPVKVHETDTAPEKPARALKHLLKLNHANHAILWNERKFHNHAPHILCSAFLQGADADDLTRIYESESKSLEPWVDSPTEISTFDWRDFLGRREYGLTSLFTCPLVTAPLEFGLIGRSFRYQRAYVDFFEDELVRYGYDWKEVIFEYLFAGKEPIFNSLIEDLGHPLIHLAYAFEMNSREIGMEALSLTTTCYGSIHKYLDDPSYSRAESSYNSTSLLTILNKVRTDQRFNGLFGHPGAHNMEVIFREHEAALLNHWNAWKIEDPINQFRESQEVAAAILTTTRDKVHDKYDFFFVHLLTTSHAVRILLPLIPGRYQIPLVKQWWLITLAIYISQLRPEINMDYIRNYDLAGRDWRWTAKKAVKGEHSTDAHYVKAIRACREAASTWGDSDSYFLKAAVKLAEQFSGWGGFI